MHVQTHPQARDSIRSRILSTELSNTHENNTGEGFTQHFSGFSISWMSYVYSETQKGEGIHKVSELLAFRLADSTELQLD